MDREQAGFVGERVTQARHARGLTAVTVAERIGVKPPAVSAYERRGVTPGAAVELELCRALELPPSFFRRPLPAQNAPARFRSIASATKRARDGALARGSWLHEIVYEIEQQVELPRLDLPNLNVPADPESLDEEMIERLAGETRAAWGMRDGPIDDVVRLLESHGVVVSRFSFGVLGDLDALSVCHQHRPLVLLNSERHSCARGRFDAAHELGHLVLHRFAPPNPTTTMHKLLEQQAHRFAQAFLFPRTAFFDEVFSISLDSLVEVKRRWRVSVGSLLMRAKQLSVASDRQLERIWPVYGRRGWRTNEPLDDEIPIEHPSILRQSYQLLVDQPGGRGELLRALPFAPRDHELLAGLPANFMSPEKANHAQIVKLTPKPSNESVGERGGARILPFRRPE